MADTEPQAAAEAVSLRLSKTEGTVKLSDRNGREMTVISDMKLYDGYKVNTDEASYAWMDLDATKLVKLDAVSEAEVQQKNKVLELLLNSGSLFFNVTESLKDDEVLNIRTSTMLTGIRGTMGWIRVVNRWQSTVYLLEGTLHCTVTDPVTGQMKQIILRAGQKADFCVYDEGHTGDRCDIFLGWITESDIPGYVAVELKNNQSIRDRVAVSTGLGVDVRGFTSMSEAMDPNDVVDILNRYLTLIASCVKRHDGTLDKFIGDAAMAFWGAPSAQDDYVMKAVMAAEDMRRGSRALEAELRERYGRTVSFGIGVHAGEAVVGNIGSPDRMDYTAIGDTVNTASRLESNAPAGMIYISREVADRLEGRIDVTSLGGNVRLKGKTEGFEVLLMDGIRGYSVS